MAMPLLHTSGLFSPTTATTTTITTATTTSLSYHRPSTARTRRSFSNICSFHREYIPNLIQDPNYVRVFDTTLREGKHFLGADMAPKQKLNIAHQISKFGVDIIEVGFCESNKDDDLESIKLIAHEVGNNITNDDDDGTHVPVICALTSCTKEDISKAWECLKYAKFPRIHMALSTREIDHTKYNLLRSSQEQVIEKAKSMVAYARSLGFTDIQCTPEDDGRSEREFLYEFLGEVIKAGATTLNIAEFIGYLPHEFRQLIVDIRANTPGIESVILSTHCHNDLGLATANTLEGAYSGARQVEVTIDGIGGEGGHASLKEVVMAMRGKTELVGGLHNGVNTSHILMTNKMVEEYIS